MTLRLVENFMNEFFAAPINHVVLWRKESSCRFEGVVLLRWALFCFSTLIFALSSWIAWGIRRQMF